MHSVVSYTIAGKPYSYDKYELAIASIDDVLHIEEPSDDSERWLTSDESHDLFQQANDGDVLYAVYDITCMWDATLELYKTAEEAIEGYRKQLWLALNMQDDADDPDQKRLYEALVPSLERAIAEFTADPTKGVAYNSEEQNGEKLEWMSLESASYVLTPIRVRKG